MTENSDLLDAHFRPEAREEPQILFRRDAAERFDEAHPYGRRPKVELFWRLGIPGIWSYWSIDPWDLPFLRLSAEAGQFRETGWVARLFSGVGDLEQSSEKSYLSRGARRAEAIRGLDDKYREVLVLRFYADHSYEEIADLLRIPLGTVKSRMFNAVKTCRMILKDKGILS